MMWGDVDTLKVETIKVVVPKKFPAIWTLGGWHICIISDNLL